MSAAPSKVDVKALMFERKELRLAVPGVHSRRVVGSTLSTPPGRQP